MKYALAFLAAFVVVAGVVAVIRLNVSSNHAGHGNIATDTHDADAHAGHQPDADPHAGHGNHASHGEKEGPWGGEVMSDLKNRADPVNGAAIGDDHAAHAHAVFHGLLIHFADEDTLARFKRHPGRYMQKLELEQTLEGSVVKVDASTYVTPELPEECPFCGMKIDPDGEIYILHRGFRIYFGCWGGCDTKFLKDAAANYAHYGLIEKDGELVKKE